MSTRGRASVHCLRPRQDYIEISLSLGALFHNISQRENVVNTASSLFCKLPVPLEPYGPQSVIGVS